eukprot:gene4458-7833_t
MSNRSAKKLTENKKPQLSLISEEDKQVSHSQKKLGNVFSELEVDELPEQKEDDKIKISTELPDSIKDFQKKKKKKKKKKQQEVDFELATKEIEKHKLEIKEEKKQENLKENLIVKIKGKIDALEKESKETLEKEKEMEKVEFKEQLMKFEELLTQQMIKLDMITDPEVKEQRKQQINRLHKLLNPIDTKLEEYKDVPLK